MSKFNDEPPTLKSDAPMSSLRDRICYQVEVASIFGFLTWGGPDWPQAHPVLGLPRWDWAKVMSDE